MLPLQERRYSGLDCFFLTVIPRLSPEIPFLILPFFTYSDWRNKLFVNTIMGLPIFVIIYKILAFSNRPCGINWGLNLFIFRVLDICVIAPVRYCTCEWAIRHLKLGGKVEGKAAINLRKKEKVKSLTSAFYIYIQLTFFVSLCCEAGICPVLLQYVWQLTTIQDLAEVVVFMFMVYKLWPEVCCKFVVFANDKEKALSNVVQCCIMEVEDSTDETPYDPFAPLRSCGTSSLGLICSP